MKKTLYCKTSEAGVCRRVSEIIKGGGIAVVPTDTVYGIAGSVFNIEAYKKIYSIKGRDYKKPLVVMTKNIDSVRTLAEIPDDNLKLIDHFWPGRLTLIFNARPLGQILSAGRKTIGIRIPDNKFMLELLDNLDIPIWTTSANKSGQESAKNFKAAKKLDKLVDVIVDGGECEYAFESTVIDATSFPYTVIRKGSLKSREILSKI
jgi:L-threonylcarbamoyladenylate synthase